MKSIFRSLLAATLLTSASLSSFAQSAPVTAAQVAPADTACLVIDPAIITPATLQSFYLFRQAVRPLIAQMADKKVVALGEGTHGTAEFYKIRFWLTRILMEDQGFNQVALENNYADCYQLNTAMHSSTVDDLKPLMKKHLLSIWQNREMEEMLNWMHTYNTSHLRKVELAGMDAMFATADAEILQQLLAKSNPELQPLTQELLELAVYEDRVWHGMNEKGFKFDRKEWLAKGWKAYELADKLEKTLLVTKLPKRQEEVLLGAAKNIKQVFDLFYQAKVNKRDASRDSAMAEMTRFLVRKKNSKVIIWAHNGHVSRKSTDPTDNNGGGTGTYLERMFPGQYFVLGTSTATGTFAATTDPFITPESPMASYALDSPIAGSWEASLNNLKPAVFYLNTNKLGAQNLKRPLRFVGYSPNSDAKSYSDFRLTEAYDVLLFVRQTTAATPL